MRTCLPNRINSLSDILCKRWAIDDGKGGQTKGGFAMQCDKNEYRGILAGLEGVTGKKAVDSEAQELRI